ncbi:MAG: AAA family ATPase [Aeromonas sobria]|uniref:AAA family ATPase n=1 Tax=Aeromonas sobria TaxID=646 RepID=UPI003F320B4E
MLAKFEVTNFKNFEEKLTFDFTKTNNYEFNSDCVKNGIVNKSLVYGHNGTGKSNLGFAILDLVSHLTDKQASPRLYQHFLNAFSKSDIADFYYEFKFPCGIVTYSYGKKDKETLVYEKLSINSVVYAEIDRRKNTSVMINAAGAENLNRDIGESQISIVSYIKKNTVLEKNVINECFYKFTEFVNGMLFFRSLESNNYVGFEQGSKSIASDIVEKGNVKDFEEFLNEAGVKCSLTTIEDSEKPGLAFVFGKKIIPFYEVASQGTKSLSLFYFWFQRLKDESKVTFLFIDEFDAFYHHSLSDIIIRKLRAINSQVVITTHNTSIMTNELLRPDCYFLLNSKGIKSLSNSTVKELREAHNIEKMYKAGAFGV